MTNKQFIEEVRRRLKSQCLTVIEYKLLNAIVRLEAADKEIEKLKGFLRGKAAISKASADNENYLVHITIGEIEQALK